MGYSFTEITRTPNKDGKMEITKKVTKKIVPDVTAQIFWLKNRQPDRWRDKQELGITAEVTVLKPGKVSKPKNAGK